jgi:DNA-binding NarL/FixJ family response regulator
MKKFNYIVVDDHQLFAEAITGLLSKMQNLSHRGNINESAKVIEFVKNQNIDLIFLDINMPEINGIEILKRVKDFNKNIKVIMLSMIEEPLVVLKCMDMKADGYLTKNTNFNGIAPSCTNEVLSGEKYFNKKIQNHINELSIQHSKNWENNNMDDKLSKLSSRETEILKHIAQGFTNSEIGEKLFLSPLTIKTHRQNILHKLNLSNTAAAVRLASEMGLI